MVILFVVLLFRRKLQLHTLSRLNDWDIDLKKKKNVCLFLFASCVLYGIEMTDIRTIHNFIEDCIRKWLNLSNYKSKHLIFLLKSACTLKIPSKAVSR